MFDQFPSLLVMIKTCDHHMRKQELWLNDPFKREFSVVGVAWLVLHISTDHFIIHISIHPSASYIDKTLPLYRSCL